MFSLPVKTGLTAAVLVLKVTRSADLVSLWETLGSGPESHDGEVVLHLPLCLPEAMSLVTPWRCGAAWGALGQPTLLRTRALCPMQHRAGPTFCLQCTSLDRAEMITVAAMKSSNRRSRIRLKFICQKRTHMSMKQALFTFIL